MTILELAGIYLFVAIGVGCSEWSNKSSAFLIISTALLWPIIWVADFHATLKGR